MQAQSSRTGKSLKMCLSTLLAEENILLRYTPPPPTPTPTPTSWLRGERVGTSCVLEESPCRFSLTWREIVNCFQAAWEQGSHGRQRWSQMAVILPLVLTYSLTQPMQNALCVLAGVLGTKLQKWENGF